ncbi:MAG: cyclase family protein [Variovorax sp.]
MDARVQHRLKKVPKPELERDITIARIEEMAVKTKNWGKWGPDDEIGTLNYVTPADIVAARSLIKRGEVFSLAIDFGQTGPQEGWGGRFNPIHTMLATGTDAVAGRQDDIRIHYADDMVTMPLQCATQWDALGHVFYGDKMWNGYDAKLVDSVGAHKNSIEKTRAKMVGRGVLLDVARHLGGDYLEDGYGISAAELDACAKAQGVEIKRGDFVIVRTGQMEERMARGAWDGYAGGDAPGFRFETAEWIHRKEIAAICADTWGCEVRPNESADAQQPWHWIVIPMIGITMGEIFNLKALAEDCLKDGVYEFFFCAPPLPISHAVGSPINPMAIK